MDLLPGTLSRLLVAYTIEFDNEVEHRLTHRTTRGPATGGRGPWLISQPFWVNFLRLVAERPRPLKELPAELINLAALERRGSRLSMGLASNVLRVVTADGVRSRDLPEAAGISREAVALSVKALQRLEAATVESNVVILTARGAQLQRHYARLVDEVAALMPKPDLAGLLDQKDDIVAALTPPADGWRANSPYRALTAAMLEDPAKRLPAYPLVTHRGGYPDGS